MRQRIKTIWTCRETVEKIDGLRIKGKPPKNKWTEVIAGGYEETCGVDEDMIRVS